MKPKRYFLLFLLSLLGLALSFQEALPANVYSNFLSARKDVKKGLWVSVFSEDSIFSSKAAVKDFVSYCADCGINEIYLQVFRSGNAYYNSSIADKSRYKQILSVLGEDPIDAVIEQARKKGIRVLAWINVLSLAYNRDADILKKYGYSVLTRDQYLNISSRKYSKSDLDRYYLRDDQLFLEPGDPRVQDYLVSITAEIIKRYPEIRGIHLDYIRYPYPVPFIPGSRFNRFGLSYGYGEESIKGFRNVFSVDPLQIEENNRDAFQAWDEWKRDQVSLLVEKISNQARKIRPDIILSCAVIPSVERAYNAAFQDWPAWIERGIIDYAVIMDYTKDLEFAKIMAKSALAQGGKEKIYIGLGAFLMKNSPELFFKQYKEIEKLRPGGIVIFSYEDIKGE